MAARASTTPKKGKDQPAAAPQMSTEERIRRRAHEIYVQRGGTEGSEMEDWLQAEREIRGSEEAKDISRSEGEGMIRRSGSGA